MQISRSDIRPRIKFAVSLVMYHVRGVNHAIGVILRVMFWQIHRAADRDTDVDRFRFFIILMLRCILLIYCKSLILSIPLYLANVAFLAKTLKGR